MNTGLNHSKRVQCEAQASDTIEQKEEVLCAGGNTMKVFKVTNEDGTKTVKFSYTLNFDLKEDIFNSVFNDKNARELMERVNSVLSGDRCA